MKKGLFFIGAAMSLTLLLSGCGNGDSAKEEAETETSNEQVIVEDNEEKETVDIETDNGSQVIAAHDFYEPFTGNMDHIHGIGYAGNQNAIFFAAHDGVKVYENGEWFKTKDFNNDYMGFTPVDKGFYTSGHPGAGVNLPNPLGLKRSYDDGQTLEDLAMEGQSDFHAMGVGYYNHAIYLLNEYQNPTLDLGFFVSKDDGQTWNEISTADLGGHILNIAVHPTNEDTVALTTEAGVYLSEDAGESFTLLTTNKQGISVHFSEDTLWYGAYGNEPELIKYSLESGSGEEIALPKMKQDAVMYFAQNPQNEAELVFSTINGDVYLSNNQGETWQLLVKQGKLQD
ncbi:F510_1955 family glycosylhydrolase [Anaerobacillus sp. MEB173]|uniref:F510_1955 family glycosylhydrolase n=1 Tax=Anaerobacillus sp. MEB173 TaxID=3383345 RepID=UPI003F9037FB